MVKAILCDLDGTLLDTLADIQASLNEMLRMYSFPELDLERTKRCIGDGAHKLVERALPEGVNCVEECYAVFKKLYAESKNDLTRPYDGTIAFLSQAKAAGVKLAIVTNKPDEATRHCEQKFFPGLFDYVAGDSGMFPCKPDPTLARFTALNLRVAPAECVFVGDGETDVRTAVNAKMRGISVTWGYRSRESLRQAGAVEFADSFEELREKIFGKV